MAIQIASKITGYEVIKPEDKAAAEAAEAEAQAAAEAKAEAQAAEEEESNIIQMHEALERPERLEGTTYKVSTPLSEHALYVTVNDIILNEGTDHEHRRPFEVFINSKNMDHFQWIVALTRIISAVFRKGGDITFLVEELKAVFDPRGGYFKRGGKFMPSLVAEIGDVIEMHLCKIGMIKNELEDCQKEFIAKKRAEFEGKAEPTQGRAEGKAEAKPEASDEEDGGFPAGAQLCVKCNTKAMVQMDNCMTCLNCGESKCG